MATLLKEIEGKMILMEGGARSEAIKFDGTNYEIIGHKPVIGCHMLVGSVTARSYSNQDYWLTTPVLEILEETEDIVKFKTKNSIYEWRK
jgi:hypothetical protein